MHYKQVFISRMKKELDAEKTIFKRTPKAEKPTPQSSYVKRRKDSLFAKQIDKLSDEEFAILTKVLMNDNMVLAIKTFAAAPFNAIQYSVMIERIDKITEDSPISSTTEQPS